MIDVTEKQETVTLPLNADDYETPKEVVNRK